MRGANPTRPQKLNDGTRLWVQDIFYTLQGEGPFTGHPAVFIRLSGCNLKCFWCDTDFESSTWEPDLATVLKRVEELSDSKCKLVVITGGEPLRQNITPLVEELLTRDYSVQIETNGTLWVDLPENGNLYIVCSPKTERLNKQLEERINTYKYVLEAGNCSEHDGLPVISTQIEGQMVEIARPKGDKEVYVMPLDSGSIEKNLANQMECIQVAKKHNYKMTLQTHKILCID